MSAVAHATEQSPPQSQGFGQELVDALSMLRAFARSLCGNRTLADDLVQETILRALSNSDKYKPGTNLDAWLITILRNHFYSLARKRRREVEDVDGAIADRMVDAPRQEGQVAMSEFLGALAQLPDKQRDSLILVGASGFSYAEAAEICRARVGTIKSRVSRARSRLERVLALASDEGVGPVAATTGAVEDLPVTTLWEQAQ